MVILNRYQNTYEDARGRTWYTEKYVIENIGSDALVKLKRDSDLMLGVTHKSAQRSFVDVNGEPALRHEFLFVDELIDLLKQQQVYERRTKREGRYKVNGKDYAGYVFCYVTRGSYEGCRRVVIAHANSIVTYFKTRKCVVVESIVACEKIASRDRKYIFQILHQFCDDAYREEPVVVSNMTQFESFMGLKLTQPPVISRPPTEYIYLVKPEVSFDPLKKLLQDQLKFLRTRNTKN